MTRPWKRNPYHAYPICTELRALRRAQRLRLDVLAEMLGYHVMSVGRWERGESYPSIQALHDWCQALGVKLTLTVEKPDIRKTGDAWANRMETRALIQKNIQANSRDEFAEYLGDMAARSKARAR